MNRTNSGANTNIFQMILDALLVLVAYLICFLIWGRNLNFEQNLSLLALGMTFAIIYVLSNKEGYLYNITMFYYLDRVHKKVTKSFFLGMLPTIAILLCFSQDERVQKTYYLFLLIAYIIVCLKIFLVRPLKSVYGKGYIPRTVFVGKKDQFNKFRYFLDKTSIRIEMLGYIAMHKDEYDSNPEDYLGCLEDLENLIREHNIDQVYIIQKHGEELRFTQTYVDLCITMGVTVRLIIDLYKRRRANSYVSTVGTYPVIAYHTITLNTYEQILKRAMDILGGLVGVILTSPFMLITAIAIKLDSPGPVFFKQVRVGQNGRHFKIYKFRSMYIDAEERKKELMAQNEIEGGVMFKMKDDPRITRVGKIIRKLSIDEFPQFFNVVQGTMSLVGTRPPTLDEVEKYNRNHWRRISIKPGITGLWQVNGRSNITNFDDIVELDVEYIDNWSLLFDIKIMFKTVLVLLKHDDAY
ncbi:MAG: sugar transferase [Lachnospiraceae bacterium]|nr:sugar transferase [Lachnospiraceae bacterium]MBQ7360793.1 sugar transferase [Lachnospiraceae bacterium]